MNKLESIEQINREIDRLKNKRMKLTSEFVCDKMYKGPDSEFNLITDINDNEISCCYIDPDLLVVENTFYSIGEFQDEMTLTDRSLLDIWTDYQSKVNRFKVRKLNPAIQMYVGYQAFYLDDDFFNEYRIENGEVAIRYRLPKTNESCLMESTPDEFIQCVKPIIEKLLKITE